MSEISGVPNAGREPPRLRAGAAHDPRAASRRRTERSALLGFAKAFKYEESVAALSAMSGVKIATLDRLITATATIRS
jgi:hypothetical protein